MAEDKIYTVRAFSGAPDWQSVPFMPVRTALWTDPAGISARGQLCHDGENLYVHMRAEEADIRAENTEPLSPVWEDSCLEFFFQVWGSDGYFNFEINPNGCLCLQFGRSRSDRLGLVRNDAAAFFGIRTGRTPDGWEVYYRIPLAFIRIFCPDARFDGEWRANMYKCGDKTANRHYLSWAPVFLKTPDFHCPEFFGALVFS